MSLKPMLGFVRMISRRRSWQKTMKGLGRPGPGSPPETWKTFRHASEEVLSVVLGTAKRCSAYRHARDSTALLDSKSMVQSSHSIYVFGWAIVAATMGPSRFTCVSCPRAQNFLMLVSGSQCHSGQCQQTPGGRSSTHLVIVH